ncbi:MAG: AMP-binding protein, partial [Candidatus Methylomirabilis sp.]|nr:AMP-binding protein [Deltaproteobacteria bacterium]
MPTHFFQGATLRELVAEQGGRFLDKTFLYFEEEEISYGKLDEIANKIGNALLGYGLAKGDRVALHLPNCTDYVLALFGCFKAGLVAVPINTMLKAPEVEHQLRNSRARAIVTTPELLAATEENRGACWELSRVIVVGGGKAGGAAIAFDALYRASSEPPPVEVAPEDLATIIYTSGTTGKPKGAELTHANYVYDARACAQAAEIRAEERMGCILPLFHVNAQVVTMLTPMIAGGSMALFEGFHPGTFLSDLERFQVTCFSAVPTVYAILNALPDAEEYDLSHLRFCICGAAPMPVEVFEEFERKYKAYILEGYGLSEGTCASTLNPLRGTRKIGSIGLALPGQEVRIVDEDGKEVDAGTVGEIVVRGPNVMRGYADDPEATAEALRDGWLRTGDLGRRDAEGYFYIEGRKKEMIICGGENIYPREIEGVLHEHPGVLECAVVGVPHAVYGEEPAAVLV